MRALIDRLQADGCLAVIFVLVAVAAYLETSTFRGAAAEWPRAVIAAFGLLSLLVVVRRLLFPERKR